MKKLIALLLVLILLANLAVIYLLVQNNRLLQQTLDSSVLRVMDMKTGTDSREETQPREGTPSQRPNADGDAVILVQVAEEKYLEADGSWQFHFSIENTTSTDLYIRSLTYQDNGDAMDQRMVDQDPMLFEAMMGPNPGETPLKPGDVMVWGDGHPGEHLTSRTYRFEFVGDDGVTYIAEYAYDLRMEMRDGMTPQGMDYSSDQGKDLLTLRHEANFEMGVAEGVSWVPVNIL